MANSKRKRTPKTVLKLTDLEQAKSAVLNSLTSASSRRSYEHVVREFIEWYCLAGFDLLAEARMIPCTPRVPRYGTLAGFSHFAVS